MNDLASAFAGGKAFIAFIICGDPDLETSAACVRAAAENGADIIELGVPFSDPTSEGPEVQSANVRALRGGVTVDKIFAMLKNLRAEVAAPFVLRAYANVVFSYGMKVLAYSRHMPETGDGVVEFVSLPELLVQSDVVSLHCPLNAESEKLINEEALRQMKDGAILLNTSRGGLLDEAAVAAALKTGKLYAAGVDVVSVEPVSEQNPLLGAENCIITPHIAWAPKDCRIRLMDMAVENLRSFLEGKTINRVN